MTTTDRHEHRETGDLRSKKDEDALARYERLRGKLRCDHCGEPATTVVIHRRGQRTSFAGTCIDHSPAANTTAARRIQVALAERAMEEN